ncbi:MAG: hypothetical protein Q9217_005530, partial [Psora testacea]
SGVVLQHVQPALFTTVALEVFELRRKLVREASGGPDLAVWVWVGAAHCCALVFKDLHVAVLGFGS